MIIPAGFAHVVHRFTVGLTGQRAAITYGVELQGTDFGENRAEELYDLFQTEWAAVMSTGVSHQSVLLKYGPNVTGPQFEHAGIGTGTANSPMAPPNTAWLIRKRTALGGRANRGRCYIPGVLEQQVNEGGQVLSPTLADLQTAANDWLAGLTTLEMPMVILHTSSSDPTEVSSLVADPLVATQRRRLR